MYGDFFALPGITNGPDTEGYHVPVNFSIMKALYYFSYLADAAPKVVETPLNGVAGQVELPMSSAQTSQPAARILQPYQPNQGHMGPVAQYGQAPGGYQAGVHIVGGYENAVSLQYHEGVTYKSLKFEPWLKANCLGVKTWIARTLPDNDKIIVKLWDAWKCSSDDQEHEASIYLKLRPLWGKYVPALRVQLPLEFYYALIIEYIEVIPPIVAFLDVLRCWQGSQLSHANFTPQIESQIREAYRAIHTYGVIHGDVAAHNIIISLDGQHVWIIDFEAGQFLSEEYRDEAIRGEMEDVSCMFEDLRRGKHRQYVF